MTFRHAVHNASRWRQVFFPHHVRFPYQYQREEAERRDPLDEFPHRVAARLLQTRARCYRSTQDYAAAPPSSPKVRMRTRLASPRRPLLPLDRRTRIPPACLSSPVSGGAADGERTGETDAPLARSYMPSIKARGGVSGEHQFSGTQTS